MRGRIPPLIKHIPIKLKPCVAERCGKGNAHVCIIAEGCPKRNANGCTCLKSGGGRGESWLRVGEGSAELSEAPSEASK